MTGDSIVVARPARPDALVLLFHGVGASAANLVPLAQRIAREQPRAMVVSVSGAHPSSFGAGREWFTVAGVTEQNRPARIAAALPAFEAAVAHWQGEAGVGAERTTLVGFSQGAIMSLEASLAGHPASRVVAIAGRFASQPMHAPPGVVYRFIHGDADPVIEPRFGVEAAARLSALGADAAARIVPGHGHGIDERAASLVLEALARRA